VERRRPRESLVRRSLGCIAEIASQTVTHTYAACLVGSWHGPCRRWRPLTSVAGPVRLWSRLKSERLAVSVPADQIYVGAVQGHCWQTRGRFGLSAGYQSHSLELRHLNSHNISRSRRGTRTSYLSARGRAWARGSSRDFSMPNGPTKTFDIAHQFHFSRLTQSSIIGAPRRDTPAARIAIVVHRLPVVE
jgi:hypothetical protein